MTILEVIQRGTEFLAKRGVTSPRLQVESLLAHVLQMPRMKLYLNFEQALSAAQVDTVRALVQRRANREPLQYIVGTAPFCSFDVAVNPHVLVPRPETELLAEKAWTFLNGCGANEEVAALDLCTGSGCLAIALAVNAPRAAIHASDVSAEALSLARENAVRCGTTVEFHHSDLFAALPTALRFRLIVSNPPYIPTERIATLEPEVRDHEPRQALDGGADGLDFYRRIAAQAGSFLEPDGLLMLELDDEGHAPTVEIFERENWIVERVEPDYNQRARILFARRKPG